MGFSQLQKYGRDLHLGYIYVHHISSSIPYNTSASFSKKKKKTITLFLFFWFFSVTSNRKAKKRLGTNSEA